MRIGVATAASLLLLAMNPAHVPAHDAASGWQYPINCCFTLDCRPISADWVKEGVDGYSIAGSSEIVPYGDPRVKDSPDGKFHWCTPNGLDSGRTICLYVPPRLY